MKKSKKFIPTPQQDGWVYHCRGLDGVAYVDAAFGLAG